MPTTTTIIMTPWSASRPPRIGVFSASTERAEAMRRYWDGRRWSAPWHDGDPPAIVDRARARRAERQRGIEWRGIAVGAMRSADVATVFGALEADRVQAEREELLQRLDLIDILVDRQSRTDPRFRPLR
jgi:phage terminase large subunit-like protein